MFTTIVASLASILGCLLFASAFSFSKNLQIARATGLPYVIAPIHPLQPTWMLTKGIWIRFLQCLPEAWVIHWLPVSDFALSWESSFDPYKRNGETFLTVSPHGIALFTADPSVHLQLLAASKQNKLRKKIDLVKINALYGPNVMGSHGARAKQLRRLMLPAVTSHANCKAEWEYILPITGESARRWEHTSSQGLDVKEDLSEISIAAISYMCFGQRLEKSIRPAPNHTMSFRHAMLCLVKNATSVLVAPDLILRLSPLRQHRDAAVAKDEFLRYMQDFQRDSREHTEISPDRKNLLQTLISAEAGSDAGPGHKTPIAVDDSEIFGNMFFFTIAGHETSANLLDWALCVLAIRKDVQTAVQAELDEVLPSDSTLWTYDKYYSQLFEGRIGAVMSELLRIYPASPFIFPMSPIEPFSIQIDGRQILIPKSCYILQSTAATHRNTRFWSQPEQVAHQRLEDLHRREVSPYPVSSFDPWQWFEKNPKGESEFSAERKLRRQADSGAFFPFFHGDRSCMGKQFAQTEFVAAMARIFAEYTVQLAPGKDADDEERILDDALFNLSRGLVFDMTLKRSGRIPLRFVRRRTIT